MNPNCKWCEGKGYRQEGKGVNAIFYACQLCREMKNIRSQNKAKAKRRYPRNNSQMQFYAKATHVMVGADIVEIKK